MTTVDTGLLSVIQEIGHGARKIDFHCGESLRALDYLSTLKRPKRPEYRFEEEYLEFPEMRRCQLFLYQRLSDLLGLVIAPSHGPALQYRRKYICRKFIIMNIRRR